MPVETPLDKAAIQLASGFGEASSSEPTPRVSVSRIAGEIGSSANSVA